MNDEVLIERDDGVLVVTINRPQAKNAVNRAVSVGLAEAMDLLDTDAALRVGILTGAGGNFCSGMDLKAFVAGEKVVLAGRGFCGITEAQPKKPLIAAVEGYALAGGFELAITCDLIVVASDARFGLPEVKRGLVANAGGLVRLPRQMPPRIAKEWLLTGDFFGPQRAYEMGLINQLVEPGTTLDVAKALAHKVAANGPLAIAASKQVIDESPDWPLSELFERQRRITAPIFTSQDAIEGARAFAEKRAPQWKGA